MRDLRGRLLNSGAMIAMGAYSFAPSASQEIDAWTSPLHQSSTGSLANPFLAIFEEIRAANKAGLSHAALALTLTIPDICAALSSPKGKSSGQKYADWFDHHLPVYKGHLSGKDLYSIRSGILHEARSDRPNMQWERVVFSTKGLHQGSITGSAVFGERVPDTYVVHISMFSEELITAAEKWFSANSGNPDVIRNSAFVVRYRENALVDGVVGVSGIC